MKRRQFVQTLGAGSAAVAGLGLMSGCATTGSGAKVVVVGGGYGGATAAKYVRLFSDHSIDVTWSSPTPHSSPAPFPTWCSAATRPWPTSPRLTTT